MKNILIIASLIFLPISIWSQENSITISGGYSFAKFEDTDITGTGFRINGLYEFNALEGKFSHGVAFGYIGLAAEEISLAQTITYKVNSFPLYYAPKYRFGTEKFKGFIKGALGMQFADLNREGAVALSDNDFGFYGGGGAGIMFFITENIFINAEYEIAWASNSWYKDGWMNSAMGGIGVKF